MASRDAGPGNAAAAPRSAQASSPSVRSVSHRGSRFTHLPAAQEGYMSEKRHQRYLVMGDSVVTIEGVKFVAMRPFTCFPVGDTVVVTIEEPTLPGDEP